MLFNDVNYYKYIYIYIYTYTHTHTHTHTGPGVSVVVKTLRYYPVVLLGIFYVVFPEGTMCPEVDSASESEYQEFLLGYRLPVRMADDLSPL